MTGIKVPELFARRMKLRRRSTRRRRHAQGRSDEAGPAIVAAAVVGLFPTSNQGLLNDTRDMLAGGRTARADRELRPPRREPRRPARRRAPAVRRANRDAVGANFAQERLVTAADPCQTRAVRLARKSSGLVIHGPPGTGKSQTIANVIGDHLARGERVLFVCDKRTALDVVADRLASLGLGDLFATVHDPQRDQQRAVPLGPRAIGQTRRHAAEARAEGQLQADRCRAADPCTMSSPQYYRELMGDRGGPGSFHHLVGQWLGEAGEAGNAADWKSLQELEAADFERHRMRLKEVLERGESVGYATNPWKQAAGLDLRHFLSRPMDAYRGTMAGAAPQRRPLTRRPTHCTPVRLRTRDITGPRPSGGAELADEARRSCAARPRHRAQRWRDADSPRRTQRTTGPGRGGGACENRVGAPLDAARRGARRCRAGSITARRHRSRRRCSDYAAAFDGRLAQFAASPRRPRRAQRALLR